MCLAFIALGAHPKHPLMIVTNRDEAYERPREPAHFWPEHPEMFAGRDLRRGGAWCGVTRTGKVALVTFVRERPHKSQPIRSCGELVVRFLTGDRDPLEYLAEVAAAESQYHGFNLILGSSDALFHLSNRSSGPTRLLPGIHGVSNALLNTPWPKVTRGKEALARLMDEQAPSLDAACELMLDRTRASCGMLPSTGYPAEHEHSLSSLFVVAPEIGEGTLATTVIRYNDDRTIDVVERSFGNDAEPTGEVSTRIEIFRPRWVSDV